VSETATNEAYASLDDFAEWGIRALMTTRDAGSFSTASDEPVSEVMERWDRLRSHLFVDPDLGRLATARQVHGSRVLVHDGGWTGWLRGPGADGHIARAAATALAVSVADCVPVFVAHPSGVVALLHSGWRGTEANILGVALQRLRLDGVRLGELRVVLGPAICGDCYEVSPDVYGRLTGLRVDVPTSVDLRRIIARQATSHGISDVRIDARCTRCDNHRFFSHRAGDAGRQLGVIASPG
jgi:polyphenol oxidase